ncbi:MAG: thiol reductant ABC exporter subunit CydD, partial [Nocardioidaceae bacterium]|nr:thiol reductant ABC exporter subunit CydD [Nocardioidaceae bacterium]
MRPLDPRVLTHLRPATRALLGVLAGGTLGGLLTVAQAFAIGTVLVRLVEGADWHPAAWWLVGITVARAAAAYAVDVASAIAASQVSLALRHRLLRATLDLEAQELSRHRSGELTLLATRGMTAIEPYLTRYLPTLVMATVLPGATLLAIWWLDWLSGLIVLLTLPLVPVFAILIGHATQERADKQWKLLSTLSGHFLDVVRGLPTLVAFRRAGAQAASIRRITDRYREATIETLKLAFLSSGALELIATISVALVAVNVGLRLAAGHVDFWTAMVVLLLAPEAYWPLRRVGAEFHSAAEGTAAFEQASTLLGDGSQPGGAGGAAIPAPGASLAVADLTIRYPDRDVAAIDALTATFPSPGLTAVVGPSGSGKSTLLAVLLDELTPESGRVCVGDHALVELDRDRWRASVSWSPQRPWLVAGTLADNLRLGRPDATDEQLWVALEGVALAGVVRTLPEGLDTELGDDGAGLSAGQRARLALARVVLAERPYVFLDEPTAHLDATTEAVLLDTLRTLSRTSCVIVVAHRPAVVDAADHVVTLVAPSPSAAESSQPVTTRRPQAIASSHDVTARREEPVAGTPAQDTGTAWWAGARMGTFLGAMSVASGVALTATASWLITRASEQPPVLYLMVAIVAVRTFGLGRPVLRYAERIVSHDAALRLLAERRAQVYDAIVPLVPGKLGSRRGDVLTSVVDDVDSLVDRQLRVRQPLWTALIVGLMAVALATALDLRGGLVILLSSAFSALGGLVTWRWVAAAEPAFVRRRAALSARVEEIVRSARDLVLWGADARALDSLDAAGRELGATTRRSASAVALGR